MNDLSKHEEKMNEWLVLKDIYDSGKNFDDLDYLLGRQTSLTAFFDKDSGFKNLSDVVGVVMGQMPWEYKVKEIDGVMNIYYEDSRVLYIDDRLSDYCDKYKMKDGGIKVCEMTLNGRFGNVLADYMTDLIDNKFEREHGEPLSEKYKSVLREQLLNDNKIYFDDVIKLNSKGNLFEKLRADLLDDEENETTDSEFTSSYESKNKMKL